MMRKIRTYDFFEICSKNGIGIVDNVNGIDCVRVSAYDAIILSEVIGIYYLGYGNVPFTFHGLSKVFHSALRQDFITGIYDKGIPLWSPIEVSKKYPQMLENDKFIVPVDFEDESDYLLEASRIRSQSRNANDFMLIRFETSKKGNGLESLLEFVFGRHLVEMGYFVESQAPLGHGLGTPDLVAFKGIQLPVELVRLSSGFLIELALLAFDNRSLIRSQTRSDLIEQSCHALVCEAKVENVNVKSRLDKYLSSGFFNSSCQLKTDFEEKSQEGYMSFGFDVDWKVKSNLHKISELNSNAHNQVDYFAWLSRVAAIFMLSNFSKEQIQQASKGEYLKDARKWLISPKSVETLRFLMRETGYGAI